MHPTAARRGVATKTTAALTSDAFKCPEVEYVEIVHDAANAASGAIPKRLGFTEVRRMSARELLLAASESGTDVVWWLSRPSPIF
ncbi:GNAT family N-acetyltransferase [Streptomyces sp. 8N616]|uniref:GNAT family N-acetyltransferase n=1 Tax=Streptomyces sp. 8N616 TaxID=3457414 RepID=UPI003FD0CD4E